MIELRPYQREAIDAVYEYWANGGGSPLVDLATGTGKSVVLAEICRHYVTEYDCRIIVLTHVKELVEQDLRATLRLWPSCPAGINSAGLGRRDTRSKVLFASIQSIHKQDHYSLGNADIIIIDEAHLVPKDGDGMYLKFIQRMRDGNPDLRVLGLTATPYRLDSGRLDAKGGIFDDIVYSYGIGEGVRDGYLSPLKSRNAAAEGQIDASKVAKTGGEFNAGALENAANVDTLVKAAVADIIERGAGRKGWIIFASGVDHCEAIRAELHRHGVNVASITSKTDRGDRDRWIRDFKAQNLRAMVSVGVLTTGFDAPHVDLIAMLRPTLSTGLYVQMLGRGTRLHPGKTDCLVLDFSGNVRRHGPVDAVEIKGGFGGKGDAGEAKVTEATVRAKKCPRCAALVAVRAMECVECGHIWPVEPKHEAKADRGAAVMASEVEQQWLAVDSVAVAIHTSQASGNRSLRVDYLVGFKTYSEWVFLDATGFPREKASWWWKTMTRSTSANGVDVDVAYSEIEEGLSKIDCTAIRVKRDGKFWRVVDRMRGDGTAVDEKLKVRVAEPRKDVA